MIGAANVALASAYTVSPPPVNHTSSVSPTLYRAPAQNGTTQTPRFVVSVSNGTGPFTYTWTITTGTGTVLSPSSNATRFELSGYNTSKYIVAECKVVDTGNSNYTTTNTVSVDIDFGNLLL